MNIRRAVLTRCGLYIFLAVFVLATSVMAEEIDGSQPLICAVLDIKECSADTGCQNSTVEIANIPQFIRINLETKRMSEFEKGEQVRSAEIRNIERIEDSVIMQGGEKGRGWSLVMSAKTGKFSAAVADDSYGFMLFGACTSLSSSIDR